MRVFNMSTVYEHIKQYSQNPFTLECEVCQQIYRPLNVRQHLRTKKHQKNVIESAKQIMMKEAAHQYISQTSKSSLREKSSKVESECQ